MMEKCDLCNDAAHDFYDAYSQIRVSWVAFARCQKHDMNKSALQAYSSIIREITYDEYIVAKVMES